MSAFPPIASALTELGHGKVGPIAALLQKQPSIADCHDGGLSASTMSLALANGVCAIDSVRNEKYYNECRTHLFLDKGAPFSRLVTARGRIARGRMHPFPKAAEIR